MSRITPPVTKLSHAMRSSLASTSRQSSLRDPARHALPELSATSNKHESQHRPSAPHIITIPLMQGFRTSSSSSSPSPAIPPTTTRTIDNIALPIAPGPSPLNPFSALRVPLLPDTYTPSSFHASESLDTAITGAQIHVVSAHEGERAENVLPLSEIVGNESEERWRDLAVREKETESGEKEQGVLRELWSGIVDDVFGSKGGKLAV
ncbi:hypothetical protein OIDMADRAFT_142100 [Oidiodendron maius Zn]|uniref:Uncharacterized protein n=1 Tax=Oidiodendron maius (strain Zn) TaxID=913774 RepID=A0A0C3HWD6_OIDMZ|nr:hypothetical protein OIDMADRAFT_142100 [Oidiodendron maius Zn]